MEKEERQLIRKWLKQGFIDWEELINKIKSHKPKEEMTEKELDFQLHRYASLFHFEYCPLMKEAGKCPLYKPDDKICSGWRAKEAAKQYFENNP